LDEEFVYETRIGDTLLLGSQVWRVIDLTDDRVIVADAAGATPRMPFWRGDFPWRPYALGERVGAFRRAVAERLYTVRASLDLAEFRSVRQAAETPAVQELLAWLRTDYALDAASAWHVVDYVAGQLDHSGAISSDKSILVELFDDALGDLRLVIQSPFGGKVNGLWALALASALRERTGVEVEAQSNDDGILFRFPEADADVPLDLLTAVGPDEARARILAELPNSAVFGAQFRQNAARALLAAAAARQRPAPTCARLRGLPHRGRNLSRLSGRGHGLAQPGARAGPHPARRDPGDGHRDDPAVAGGAEPALGLHQRLHVRVGRAQGRTPVAVDGRQP
jgi:ATP-dependent Lhr-like helicase